MNYPYLFNKISDKWNSFDSFCADIKKEEPKLVFDLQHKDLDIEETIKVFNILGLDLSEIELFFD